MITKTDTTDRNEGIHLGNTPTGASQATVCLVVPVFNAARYIDECLQSIASQSFRNIRIIVIDDGSTDGSVEKIENFCQADDRFFLVKAPHAGVSAARNLGIEMAAEHYIGFVDADDCLHPGAIKRMTDTLYETSSQVCIASFERGQDFVPHKQKPSIPLVFDYSTAMRHALYQRYIMNAPWGMLMERSLLGDDIRFREGIRYEDLDAFYRFYEKASRITFLRETLYFYRQAPGSFMQTWSQDRLDVLDVTDRMAEYMRVNHPELHRAALDRRFSAHFNMLLEMLKLHVRDPHPVRRCLKTIHAGRANAITDPRVRIKNKLGALASFGGTGFLKILARFY